MESGSSTFSTFGPQASARPATMSATPWYCPTIVFAAFCILVGIVWDISWHSTIGRDTFWTPAHICIHFGGTLGGFMCGWLVLRATFLGTAEDRAASVRVWGFRGPLGAWVTIWGALAMLTSAPFDNWWHDAYGLVPLREVPHIVREVIDIVRGVPHIVRGVIDIVREVPRMLRRAAIIDRGASWAVRGAVTTRAEAAIPSRDTMILVRDVPSNKVGTSRCDVRAA